MRPRYYLTLWLLACLLWAALWLAVLPWPPGWPLVILAAWLTADAGSYCFHVVLDHHLRAERSEMARGFQAHHQDGAAITREPLPETLAAVVSPVLPVWLLAASLAAAGWLPAWLALYGCVLGLGVGFGQVFHRWAHLERPGPLVAWAQRLGLVVAPRAHAAHHAPPVGTAYAIVCGWSNPLFDALALDRCLSALLARLGWPRVA